jgi:hypothetical protein
MVTDEQKWTDAAWAEEYCARAQRQADTARAEARVLSALVDELREALDASQKARGRAEEAALKTRPIGADGPWVSPRVVAVAEELRREADQRLVDGIVDAASAAKRGAPRVVRAADGRDPGSRTRGEP